MDKIVTIYVAITILVFFLLRLKYRSLVKKAPAITIDKIRDLKDSREVRFIDVRSYREIEAQPVVQCEKIAHNLINTIEGDKNQKIILFCNSGIRASFAAEVLIKKKFKNVYYFSGDMMLLKSISL